MGTGIQEGGLGPGEEELDPGMEGGSPGTGLDPPAGPRDTRDGAWIPGGRAWILAEVLGNGGFRGFEGSGSSGALSGAGLGHNGAGPG